MKPRDNATNEEVATHRDGDEDIVYQVSDEALEAAANMERARIRTAYATYTPYHCNDCD